MALSLQHFCATTARCIQKANDDYCLEDYFEKHSSTETWYNKKRGRGSLAVHLFVLKFPCFTCYSIFYLFFTDMVYLLHCILSFIFYGPE